MTTYRWAEMTREEVAQHAINAVTILPVASIEQHGPHLATITDTALLDEVIARACTAIDDDVEVLLAPTQIYGSSDHHLPFGGTLSLTSETFHAVLRDLLRSVAHAGCKRTLLLNGHGGNAATCRVAAADASRVENVIVVTASYWELISPPIETTGLFPGHAGEFETSLLLAIDPDLVHLDRARKSPGSIEPPLRGLHINSPGMWEDIDGFTDDPRSATGAMGDVLLSRCADGLAQAIRDVRAL